MPELDLSVLVEKLTKKNLMRYYLGGIPCTIVKYYEDEHEADVQPQIPQILKNSVKPGVIIPRVPVADIHWKKAYIRLPVDEGDEGIIEFGKFNMDEFFESGESKAPKDHRMYNLNDAYISCGVTSAKRRIKTITGGKALEIFNDGSHIIVDKSGVKVQNSAEDLIDLSKDMTLKTKGKANIQSEKAMSIQSDGLEVKSKDGTAELITILQAMDLAITSATVGAPGSPILGAQAATWPTNVTQKLVKFVPKGDDDA